MSCTNIVRALITRFMCVWSGLGCTCAEDISGLRHRPGDTRRRRRSLSDGASVARRYTRPSPLRSVNNGLLF